MKTKNDDQNLKNFAQSQEIPELSDDLNIEVMFTVLCDLATFLMIHKGMDDKDILKFVQIHVDSHKEAMAKAGLN
jgi:hypothetical protein